MAKAGRGVRPYTNSPHVAPDAPVRGRAQRDGFTVHSPTTYLAPRAPGRTRRPPLHKLTACSPGRPRPGSRAARWIHRAFTDHIPSPPRPRADEASAPTQTHRM